ncbi:Melibiase [compost metagenome]
MFISSAQGYTSQVGSAAISVSGDKMTFTYGEQTHTLKLNLEINGFMLQITAWRLDQGVLFGQLDGSDLEVKLSAADQVLEYTIAGTSDHYASIGYFTGSSLPDTVLRGFLPDYANKLFQSHESVTLSYSATAKESQFDRNLQPIWMTCPAPKTVAFNHKWTYEDQNWWGLILPDPLPVFEAVINKQEDRFQVAFTYFHGASYQFKFPRIQFHFDLCSEEAILERYLDYYKSRGYLDEQAPYYEWWSRPLFCTWGQQEYLEKSCDFQDNPMTASSLDTWVQSLEDLADNKQFTIIVDSHWFNHYGEFKVHSQRFGTAEQFRAQIDRLKVQGHKVVLWYTPLWVSPDSSLVQEHPEYLVKDMNGDFAKVTNTEIYDYLYLLDCSREDVRAHIKQTIRFMLSEEADCLNADGFKIDMNYYGPIAGKHQMYSYDWGIGEVLWANLLKLIKEEAIQYKQDAFLTLSGAEPYLQPFAPAQRLNDLFPVVTDSPKAWYKRARLVSKMLPGVLIDVDGWPSTRSRSRDYWFVSSAFGIPVTYHIDGFDNKELLSPEDANLLKAVWNAYMNAPVTPDMELIIDPEQDVFCRKYTKGPLKGFYSAISLQQHVLVVYNENQAIAVSNKSMVTQIPVPPGKEIAEIYQKEAAHAVSVDYQVVPSADGKLVQFSMNSSESGIVGYYIEFKDKEK